MVGHHHHHHETVSYGKAFKIGIALNLAYVAVEAWYGWQIDSLALLADAGHNLSDVGGLLLAWAAFAASTFKPTSRHSYGWQKGSVIASFINALILLFAMGALAWEAVHRITTPAEIEGWTVIWVASFGVFINTVTAWMLMQGSGHDMNIRGAFLHMAADALVSVGVVLAGILYLIYGWSWIDPVLSLIIAVVIILSTYSLFRGSLHLLFDGVPEGLDLDEVHGALAAVENVESVHDVHIWALSTTINAITAHVVVRDGSDRDSILSVCTELLAERFNLKHVSLQLESVSYGFQCTQLHHCTKYENH